MEQFMLYQSSVVASGGYISLIKLLVFLGMFFAWMPLVNWVHTDAQAVRTKVRLWTSTISITGATTLIVWLLAPMFLIGFLIYLIAIGSITIAYIIHRDSRVADFERILSANNFKTLFVDEDKKIAKASKGMVLVTANGNDVPLPKPKSPDAFGFQTTCDIFEDAIWRRVSEIAFQPARNEYNVIYRIDGQAIKQEPRDREEMEYFLSYLKQLADLNIEEKRKPQTGMFTAKKDSVPFKWEVTTAGSTAGEQARVRKIEEHSIMSLDDIGLTEKQLDELKSLKELEHGLILISGPKKSGVTTTFYAMLKNHDPFLNDINTLEKQPAAELQNITQKVYSMSDSGSNSYADQLRSIVRMGPNIIGVSECEDAECVKISCNAASSGRVIHAATETSSVIKALGKFLKLASDKNLVLDNLTVIINQRLVRTLCNDCKQAYQPNKQLLKKFNLSSDKIKLLYRPGDIEYDKHGKPIYCEKCQGTGFYGRTGIFETILITDEIRDAIKKAKNLQEISSIFRRNGLQYMQEQSISKVTVGITSINEVIREFSSSPKQAKKPKAKTKD